MGKSTLKAGKRMAVGMAKNTEKEIRNSANSTENWINSMIGTKKKKR